MSTTITVFRKWRSTGTIIALFPAIAWDRTGTQCASYEHVGQHGGADYHGVIAATVPATEAESRPLAQELASIGYALRPAKRASARTRK